MIEIGCIMILVQLHSVLCGWPVKNMKPHPREIRPTCRRSLDRLPDLVSRPEYEPDLHQVWSETWRETVEALKHIVVVEPSEPSSHTHVNVQVRVCV